MQNDNFWSNLDHVLLSKKNCDRKKKSSFNHLLILFSKSMQNLYGVLVFEKSCLPTSSVEF